MNSDGAPHAGRMSLATVREKMARAKRNQVELNQEQLDRLRAFAEQHGRDWKHKLRTLWMQGKDSNEPQGHLLRQVRNRVGPSGLDRVKL